MREVIGQEHTSCHKCDRDTYLSPIVKTRQGWAHRACVEAGGE